MTMATTAKYPNIRVNLSDCDGNAFMILGAVGKALRRAKVPQAEIDAFYAEAQAGDYDNLLRVCMAWVDWS
jgi:hypothetical protein